MFFIIVRSRPPLKSVILPGYKISRSGSGQPTLEEKPEENAKGVLAIDLDDFAIERLDGFHGPNYAKRKVNVILDETIIGTHAYILKTKQVIHEGIIDFSSEE